VTSVGISSADPLADFRALFDIRFRLLAQTLAYARALKTDSFSSQNRNEIQPLGCG